MASERVMKLQEWCEAAEREIFNGDEAQEVGEAELPASVMVPYLIDGRRKLKVMNRQLCVLDNMLLLLESLKVPDDLLSSSCPQDIDEGVHAQWKALKAGYKQGIQAVEEYITALQDRMEQTHSKMEKLGQLRTALESKREKADEKERLKLREDKRAERQKKFKLQEVEEALATGWRVLRLTEGSIVNLKTQVDAHLTHLDNLTQLRDRLQQKVQATLGLTGYRLLWMGPDKLCVEVIPKTCCPSLGPVDPLRLSLTWSPHGIFTLQGDTVLLPESLQGPLSQVSAALLEVMQRYLSQGEMLAEIQGLHSRFAIDWRPARSELVFLKSASIVCHLCLGEGYPSRGCCSLLSVRKESGPVSVTSFQPPQGNASLTEWLEFLSSCPQL